MVLGWDMTAAMARVIAAGYLPESVVVMVSTLNAQMAGHKGPAFRVWSSRSASHPAARENAHRR